jgi:hypothetical protein
MAINYIKYLQSLLTQSPNESLSNDSQEHYGEKSENFGYEMQCFASSATNQTPEYHNFTLSQDYDLPKSCQFI